MALTPEDAELILQIRLLIGDIESSPFYPLLSDDEYLRMIDMFGRDPTKVAKFAAMSAAFVLTGWSTRERTGDIEVYNNMSTSYLAALREMRKGGNLLPATIPWMATDCIPNPIRDIKFCDDHRVNTCGCK